MSGYKGIAWTLCLVFVVTFLTQILAAGFNVFDMDIGTLQAAANAAIAAVFAFVVNYLTPAVDRYGVGAK